MAPSILSMTLMALNDCVRAVHDPVHRRLRAVDADPSLATVADLESLARAHGTPETQVWQILDRVETLQLDVSQVWSWAVRHDAIALAEHLEASFDYELVERYGSATAAATGARGRRTDCA